MIVKYAFGALLIIVLFVGYFINKSNKEDMARLIQAEKAQIQKIENEKHEEEVRSKIKELQSKIQIDPAEARGIIESGKIPNDGKNFYSQLSGKWSDSIKIASSTPRIALSQPITELQRLKRELETRKPANFCDNAMKLSLNTSYDYAIDGFLAFAQDNNFKMNTSSELSNKYMDKALVLMDYCYK